MAADLIVELRCEELPVSMIAPALRALEKGLVGLLEGVEHGSSHALSTPRRLAVVVRDVASGRPLEQKQVTGPSLAIAQKDGEWTRAAQGFARGKGLAVEQLEIVEGPKGPVIAATVQTGGESTADLVAQGLEKLVLGLPFRKSMRWGSGAARFGRPLHAVVATLGGELIPASVAGVVTSTEVVGHRLSDKPSCSVSTLEEYLDALRHRGVIADRAERRALIEGLLDQVEAELSVTVLRDALLDEVTDLVECPTLVVSRFDDSLLELPHRLLVEAMQVHQRYFPTLRREGEGAGELASTFVVISNNPVGDAELIAEGNRRVLAARFHDARFFFAEDRKKTLAQHGEGLDRMRWVRGLGTMADKQARIARLARLLAPVVGAEPDTAHDLGLLVKCDLLSQMVGEFPKLQGHMGGLYAQAEGLADALAIEEHYLPRHAGDALPTTATGRALGLADRLDTLAGCFGIGLTPRGSADPQGLRRAANGVNALLLGAGIRAGLDQLFEQALHGYNPPDGGLEAGSFDQPRLKKDLDETRDALVEFTLSRLRASLMAEGHATDIVDAVLGAGGHDVVQLRARVEGLSALSSSGEFRPLMVAFKRVMNISKDHPETAYDPARFEHDAERALEDAFLAAESAVPAHVEALQVERALGKMVGMKGAIDHYFDEVLVMADDPALRAARLGLLRSIGELFRSVADFRHISTE